MTDGVVEPPPLEAVDVYLYAFGNGAIYRYDADRASGFATLAEAVALAQTCGSFGGRVFLAGDTGPLADATRHAVRITGVPIVEYRAPMPPYVWDHGGDALMSAAAGKQDDLFDDLLERGADVDATNDDGATALHHAAAAGYVHGVERLLAAGADPDVRNRAGLTALMAAQACREHEAAMVLEAAGATPSHAAGDVVTFHRSHRLPQLGGLILGPVWGLVFGIWGLQAWGPVGGVLVFVAVTVAAGLVIESPTTWTGLVPRRFDGRRLHGTTFFGREVAVDLDDVTQAAFMQVGGRAARFVGSQLVLAHPGGRPISHVRLRRILRPKDEADHIADGAPVTFVLLDPWWEHEVLQPLGTRLISDPVELSPRLRGRLREARDEDPTLARRGRRTLRSVVRGPSD
jgi:hypothetical protein